jgi:hypothetical protein
MELPKTLAHKQHGTVILDRRKAKELGSMTPSLLL